MAKLPIVGVIGSGTQCYPDRTRDIGQLLAKMGVHLLTGGGGGVMSSVSQAFHEVSERQGCVIGVLPCSQASSTCEPKSGYPNPWVEIPIVTHLPLSGKQGRDHLSRNHINVLTADVVIVLPGGPGTVSEVELALQYKRPVIAFIKGVSELSSIPRSVLATGEIAHIQEFLQDSLKDRLITWPKSEANGDAVLER